jgi:large subunit ribosomal protein L20
MARVKRGVTTHARHKKVLDASKGFVGRSSTNYRIALERLEKSLQYAYRDRKVKKRDFRSLWIQRINAAVREHGMTYSKFIAALKDVEKFATAEDSRTQLESTLKLFDDYLQQQKGDDDSA